MKRIFLGLFFRGGDSGEQTEFPRISNIQFLMVFERRDTVAL